MEVVTNHHCMSGDPRLVDQIMYELKAQGIFDNFRKECIADVDTKPAYQNLRQRVEGSVTGFLRAQEWKADMNKNQVREMLRKNISESGFLDTGVERIVDQVVNPKMNTIFLPKIEEVYYQFMGIEKPNRNNSKEFNANLKLNMPNDNSSNNNNLLPTDLESVSPDSEIADKKLDQSNESQKLDDSKVDDDESPPFEPITEQMQYLAQEENSVDSQFSGFSGLVSHDSNHSVDINKQPDMDSSIQESQMSKQSSDDHLSIVMSDDADSKMEICEDSYQSRNSKSNDSNNKIERTKSDDKIRNDDKFKDKYRCSDKYKSKYDHDKDKKSDRDRKEREKHVKDSKDRDRSKDKKDSRNKTDREKSSKSSEKIKDSKSDKESKDKHKDNKSEKDKSRSKQHSSSSRDRSTSKKESNSKDTNLKDKSKSSKPKSHDDSKNRDRSKHDSRYKKDDKHHKQNSNSKDKKDSKKELKDDHYSSKWKKSDRRSTDRDSNDGNTGNATSSNSNESSQSQRQQQSQELFTASSGSGDSGNSDQSEIATIKAPVTITDLESSGEITIVTPQVPRLKLIKPKFASNIFEARRLMKIRKQLKEIEKQNQFELLDTNVLSSLMGETVAEDKNQVTYEVLEETENIAVNASERKRPNILKKHLTHLMQTPLKLNNLNVTSAESIEEKSDPLEKVNANQLLEATEGKFGEHLSYFSQRDQNEATKTAAMVKGIINQLQLNIIELASAFDQNSLSNRDILIDVALSNEFNSSINRGPKRKSSFIHSDLHNNNKINHLIEDDENEIKVMVKSDSLKLKKVKSNDSIVLNHNSFTLPLSPADSEKSIEKVHDGEHERPKRQNNAKKGANNSQRYTSEDLYKPRLFFNSSSRRRGAKNLE